MRTPAGKRDTEITFRERTGTQSQESGAWSYTWSNVARGEWAEVVDYLPSRGESISEGIDITRRPCRIRFPYRTDIDGSMRIVVDGRTLEIVSGPVERIGRREELEVIAQELSTQGEAP